MAIAGPRLIKSGYARIPLIAVGVSALSISLLSMGLISAVSSNWLFLALAHLSRIGQGFGDGLVQSCYYSVLASLFPSRLTLFSALLNTFENLGCIIGPVGDAFLYNLQKG